MQREDQARDACHCPAMQMDRAGPMVAWAPDQRRRKGRRVSGTPICGTATTRRRPSAGGVKCAIWSRYLGRCSPSYRR